MTHGAFQAFMKEMTERYIYQVLLQYIGLVLGLILKTLTMKVMKLEWSNI